MVTSASREISSLYNQLANLEDFRERLISANPGEMIEIKVRDQIFKISAAKGSERILYLVDADIGEMKMRIETLCNNSV